MARYDGLDFAMRWEPGRSWTYGSARVLGDVGDSKADMPGVKGGAVFAAPDRPGTAGIHLLDKSTGGVSICLTLF